jgi:hypothetical protein
MNREQVQAVVVKHLVDAVDGLKAEGIDPTRSMKDLGANSLDIVEVVSASTVLWRSCMPARRASVSSFLAASACTSTGSGAPMAAKRAFTSPSSAEPKR